MLLIISAIPVSVLELAKLLHQWRLARTLPLPGAAGTKTAASSAQSRYTGDL